MISYVLWTGGFDSTCLILYMHNNNIPYIPIYILNVDNRKNSKSELNIINKITNKYKLIPPVIVDNIKLSNEILDKANYLYKLGFGNKPIHQYVYIAQYLQDNNIKGHVGIVKNDKLEKDLLLNNSYINDFYKNFIFLFKNKTKEELLQLFHKDKEILDLTISCWNLDIYNNKCNRCKPCINRIL